MGPAAPVIPAGAGFRDEPAPRVEDRARVRPLRAALLAFPVLVGTLMLISEIAGDETWKPGVDSSTWTPLRGVAALVFGTGAYGGDFALLPILAGLTLLGVYAVVFGSLGALALQATLGPGANPLAGLAYGLFIQAVVVNLGVNVVQAKPTVYHSLPSWGWWVANGAFGAALGLAAGGRDPR